MPKVDIPLFLFVKLLLMILESIKLIIASLVKQELVVSSFLQDLSVRQNDDLIGMLYG